MKRIEFVDGLFAVIKPAPDTSDFALWVHGDGTPHYLGRFPTEQEAEAYLHELFGEPAAKRNDGGRE